MSEVSGMGNIEHPRARLAVAADTLSDPTSKFEERVKAREEMDRIADDAAAYRGAVDELAELRRTHAALLWLYREKTGAPTMLEDMARALDAVGGR